MILGNGIDILDVGRIEEAKVRWGDRFFRRIFTEGEIKYCMKRARSAECFALRFAAKEAFLKAIGRGLQGGIRWTDIEVGNDAAGKPFLALYGKAKQTLENIGAKATHLTLSHDGSYAIAYVLLEG